MRTIVPIFDYFTLLDAAGPFEVLQRVPGNEVTFVAEHAGPVRAEGGVMVLAQAAFSDTLAADVLLVPGGFGTRILEHSPLMLDWLRAIDQTTRVTSSVCTGSMLLGAAGLLRGRRATTHWGSLERLAEYGAVPVQERFTQDEKYMTSAGVSAGIDMALALAARLASEDVARAIQLSIEYDPAPPFDCGSPSKAGPKLVELVRQRTRAVLESRGHE